MTNNYDYTKNLIANNINPDIYNRNIYAIKCELRIMGEDEDLAYKMPIPTTYLSGPEIRNMIYNIRAIRSATPQALAAYEREQREKDQLKQKLKRLENEKFRQEYEEFYDCYPHNYREPTLGDKIASVIFTLLICGLLGGAFVFFYINDYMMF